MSQFITRADFGFLPLRLTLTGGGISIETRADFDETISDLEKGEGIEGDWLYAPPQLLRTFGGAVREMPYPSRVFGLPKTHIISGVGTDEIEHLKFHVWVLSFFLGMRLTTTDAGFLDATSIKPHKLIDFYISQPHLPKALALAEAFWLAHRHDPARAKRWVAAVHALFVAQCPRCLQFEEFIYLYAALDACYALAASTRASVRKIPHSRRVSWMCGLFGITPPDWAQSLPTEDPEIAVLRNATLHEALFMDEPLGFALHGVGSNRNLLLEMKALICRLLVALIGGEANIYVKSPVNTRMMYSLDLP
jgi:hypothetical protein